MFTIFWFVLTCRRLTDTYSKIIFDPPNIFRRGIFRFHQVQKCCWSTLVFNNKARHLLYCKQSLSIYGSSILNALDSIKRLLRYLNETISQGFFLRHRSFFDSYPYIDANWAWCPDDCSSQGGFCISFCQELISWSSQNYGFQIKYGV